jgi:hypothetical protein
MFVVCTILAVLGVITMKAVDGMKRCPKCGGTKEVAEFARSYGTNDGYQVYCKACFNAYTREYAKKRREMNRQRHLGEKVGDEV